MGYPTGAPISNHLDDIVCERILLRSQQNNVMCMIFEMLEALEL